MELSKLSTPLLAPFSSYIPARGMTQVDPIKVLRYKQRSCIQFVIGRN